MSHNKSVKNRMFQLYGKKCFIEKLGIRTGVSKKYKSSKQYRKMKELTYHHIIMKSEGGETSIENGSILCVECHTWFHQQDKETQDILNELFQEIKDIEYVDGLELPYEIKCKVIQFNEKGKVIEKEREEERYEQSR